MKAQLYHPVIRLPENYEVCDFTQGYDPNRVPAFPYSVGRYNEKRPGMYTGELYDADRRDIHMGIDIGAPIGTEIFAFDSGEVFLLGNNNRPWDYGFTIITKHMVEGEILFALFGHLSGKSVEGKRPGQRIKKGEVIAWIGDKNENGGWNPHLHFQLSRVEPKICDLPGVVSEAQREEALRIYPDPRLILGPIY